MEERNFKKDSLFRGWLLQKTKFYCVKTKIISERVIKSMNFI